MGMMGSMFGGGEDSDDQHSQSSSKTTVEPPLYVRQGGKNQYKIAEALQRQPYQPYSGPRVAPFSDDENAAFDMVRSSSGEWGGDLNASRSLVNYGTTPWADADISQYTNPYTEAVSDIAAREVRRGYDTDTAKRTNASAVGAGAFGGARHGVAESENIRNREQAVADIYTTGGRDAYEAARAGYGDDRAAMLDGARQSAGIGSLMSQLRGTDATRMIQTGGMRRGMDQSNLDTAYDDFVSQRNYPYEQSNYATGILKGIPYGQTTETNASTTGSATGSAPPPNMVGQIMGAGMTGMSMYNMMSDRSVKRDIVPLPADLAGAPLYAFRYLWDDSVHVGCMADEVEQLHPDAVSERGGLKMVDYGRLLAAEAG